MSEASKGALRRGMTPTHELMVDWILQNPGGTLRQMGHYFGYSPSWLCTVMKSDAFRAYSAERLGEVHSLVSQGIPARMEALATLAIDRMEDVLKDTQDADTITESFDKVMHRYGYAPGSQKPANGAANVQNNVFFLSPQQLQQHREVLINGHSNAKNPPLPSPASEKPVPVPDDEALPTGS